MRAIILCLVLYLPALLKGQKLAIGGSIAPTFGNIAVKSDYYEPMLTFGGGLNFNYYNNRWLFSTGVNFKNAGGSQKIPVTTTSQPEGDGAFVELYSKIYIFTIPVGVNYALVNKENFNFLFGLTVENGYVLNKHMGLKNKDFNHKKYKEFEKGYYFGIIPEIRMECNLSPKIFLFSKIGLGYQLNTLKIKNFGTFGGLPEWREPYRINNLFIDIGFGYRLKN